VLINQLDAYPRTIRVYTAASSIGPWSLTSSQVLTSSPINTDRFNYLSPEGLASSRYFRFEFAYVDGADVHLTTLELLGGNPLARLWTPAELTTLAWYDTDDASTITLSGSNVTQWDDKR